MHQSYLQAIKSFEGFTPQAKWDYAQHSNGYGTKALYPGEAISPDEAERRFAAEIAVARSIVEKHATGWDEGTKAALTSLTFNAGTRWISSGLGEAVRNNDIEAVRERFVQYAKAGGEVLPGLVKRRLAELDWIGAGLQGGAGAAATSGAAEDASAVSRRTAIVPAVEAVRVPDIVGWPRPVGSPEPEAQSATTALRDEMAALASSDPSDARGLKSLSMLITLLFDLQMRTAQAADGTAGHPDQPG